MFEIVVNLCKNVIDFIQKDKEIESENKQKISVVLEDISKLLQDTADKLKNDEYPHANCIALKKLSDNLRTELLEVVEHDKVDGLHMQLVKASQIEREYAFRKQPNTITVIENASGEFKAMAILLKA